MSPPLKRQNDRFEEGVDARAAGRKLDDNPYCIRTEEHADWAAGWHATFDLDEENDPDSNRDRSAETAGDE